MPKKVGKSILAGKIRPDAVKAHAGDETSYGFVELPGGVSGIAQLVDCKFDQYKKGNNKDQFFWYAAGVLVEVNDPAHQHLIGQRTSITVPACDTKNQKGEVTSQEEHVARIMNEMRKLGASTAEVSDGEDLENLASALLEAAPYFRFSTSQSPATKEFPNPRVWHNWNGNQGLDGYTTPDSGGSAGVEDSSDEVATESNDEPEADDAEGDDPRTLAGAADDGDEAAAARLTEMAVQAGISQDDVANASSWSAVADMIKGEGDDGPKTPEVGEVWDYKPPKAKKAISCEVTIVNSKQGTVSLKNLDDGKTIYKGVKFEALEH